MSQHQALVVPIEFKPHPNADSLSIVSVGGFQCIVNSEQWKNERFGVYIMPDSIVDVSRPEFSFLNRGREKERIKCVRLRGEFSQGLLAKVPDGFNEGDDLWNYFGLEWYEPELHLSTTGDFAAAPTLWGGLSKYDVENCRRSDVSRMFQANELVEVTAKLNGSNCSFVYTDGEMYVRSRSGFRKQEEGNMFWQALKASPFVETFCKANPDTLVYGEAYGNVKNFKYDCKNGEVKFRVFDIMNKDRTYLGVMDRHQVCEDNNLDQVPRIGIFPFDMNFLVPLAEGDCPLGNSIPEGIVLKPLDERRCGNERVMAKIVSNKYLEKS